ncbi:hypothetical protein OG21DRAFT_1506038 [Imleria badia]|nr:hypothetical protein OG21DRAFT_1506038 [Imleria badia]
MSTSSLSQIFGSRHTSTGCFFELATHNAQLTYRLRQRAYHTNHPRLRLSSRFGTSYRLRSAEAPANHVQDREFHSADAFFRLAGSKRALVLCRSSSVLSLVFATTSNNAARTATHRPLNHNPELCPFRHIPPPQIKFTLIIPSAPTPSTSQDIHVQRVAVVNLPRTSR